MFGEHFLPTNLWVPLKLIRKGEHPVARWRREDDRTWSRFVAPPGEAELFIVVNADQPNMAQILDQRPTPDELGSLSLVIDVNKIKVRIAEALSP